MRHSCVEMHAADAAATPQNATRLEWMLRYSRMADAELQEEMHRFCLRLQSRAVMVAMLSRRRHEMENEMHSRY